MSQNIVDEVIDCAEEVHAELGTYNTESTYHRSLEYELSSRGIGFTSEATIPIFYKGMPAGRRRPDIVVQSEDGDIVLELKSGSSSGDKQLLQYLELMSDDNNYSVETGLLIKFNSELDIVQKDISE